LLLRRFSPSLSTTSSAQVTEAGGASRSTSRGREAAAAVVVVTVVDNAAIAYGTVLYNAFCMLFLYGFFSPSALMTPSKATRIQEITHFSIFR
jgi:hypothetical protein